MGIRICMLGRKGGVGKTSLSIHLAGYLAREESLSVRLVDLDSQASLSNFFLGAETVENLPTDKTVQACFGGQSLEAVEHATTIDGVRLVPCNGRLDVSYGDEFKAEGTIPDLTIFDCPPDLSNRAIRAAMFASNFALSPFDPESFGAESILRVLSTLHTVAIEHQDLNLLGFIINKRMRRQVHGYIEGSVRRMHQGLILDTVIPNLTAFAEAIYAKTPITEYLPKSPAAGFIRDLASEVFDRIEVITSRPGKAA